MRFGVHWFPRVILAMVFIPHGVGKLVLTDEFADKFALPYTVSIATGVAELLGVALVLAAPLLAEVLHREALTLLGLLPIVVIQIGAVVLYHLPRWWYYIDPPGVEYNLVILGLCAMLAYTASGHRLGRRPSR